MRGLPLAGLEPGKLVYGWCAQSVFTVRSVPSLRQVFGVALSYRPMFYELSVAIFGTPKDLFKYDAEGHELHVDRVVGAYKMDRQYSVVPSAAVQPPGLPAATTPQLSHVDQSPVINTRLMSSVIFGVIAIYAIVAVLG